MNHSVRPFKENAPKAKRLGAVLMFLSLVACATHPAVVPPAAIPQAAPVVLPPPLPPTPKPIIHAAPPHVDASACLQGCRAQLLGCQETPAQCDGLYSACLSHC